MLWYIFVGWWLTGISLAIGYVAGLTVVGLPPAFWIFNRTGTLLTLRPRTQTPPPQSLPPAHAAARRDGVRIGELEALTWGDVDEPRQRWRVSGAVSKTGRARWVPVPVDLFESVTRLVAREDRVPERAVFQGFSGDRFRTALTRACTAAGVPHFSPHDLRHRRVSLLHLAGMPWARIGELVGHDDLVTTVRTYTHVIADERELNYDRLLASASFAPK